jgi:hypothetical protein
MKCLTPDCGCEKIKARGLCVRCYTRLKKQVSRGDTTWGSLIEKGVCNRATRIQPSLTTAKRRKAAIAAIKKRNDFHKFAIAEDIRIMGKLGIGTLQDKLDHSYDYAAMNMKNV